MDWSSHYPAFIDPDHTHVNALGKPRLTKEVEIADIGCGYGGLLVALAPLMPETLMVGKSDCFVDISLLGAEPLN